MWTLEDGLALVRTLQPLLRPLDFHVALGGGVLNRGVSDKDLDLYILPVYKGNPHDFGKLHDVLCDTIGTLCSMRLPSGGHSGECFSSQHVAFTNGRRVDVFVVDPQTTPTHLDETPELTF